MPISLTFEEHPVLSDSPEQGATRLEYDVEQIYQQTRADICSYVLYLGIPEAQAQEVTQEVYLRLYQTMCKGETILNMRAWLFRVAHNMALKVRSREKVFRVASLDWDRLTYEITESPERRILDREKMQCLHAALNTLSPQQRNCLYLRSEGLRYREIAEVIGISSSTVNEFLRRAISRLAEAVHA